jgi:hypothetical protein
MTVLEAQVTTPSTRSTTLPGRAWLMLGMATLGFAVDFWAAPRRGWDRVG